MSEDHDHRHGHDADGDDTDGDDRDHSHAHHHDHSHGHSHHAHDLSSLGFAVVTVSTSRTVEDDPAGDLVVTLVEEAGHTVDRRAVVDDDRDTIEATVRSCVDDADIDVVVTAGGTGVTPDDVTIEAVEPLFDKTLPGFGELFRHLSLDDIGTRVVGTRATAGIIDGDLVVALPGSRGAVETGIAEVVLPEAPHLVGLARR